ncbi:MAG: hypothetical protein LC667_08800 [Thioalkalivibrio sp.]|nr:hypothetical protein [Thioalkalivibrio sp.]
MPTAQEPREPHRGPMGGFRLGSVFGFEIRIDYSWFVIAFLILWSLSAGVFPMRLPDLAPTAYLVMGVVGTVLFFASLVAHELSHSLVARTRGVEVSVHSRAWCWRSASGPWPGSAAGRCGPSR